MQTETVFRAARLIRAISDVRIAVAPTLQHSLGHWNGEVVVTITGAMEHELHAAVEEMNTYATSLDDADMRFTLEFVSGNAWRVEAA